MPHGIEFPTLTITPGFRGLLSPTELLRTEGSIQFRVPHNGLSDDGSIVFIADHDFLFFVGFGDGSLMFARGNDMLRFRVSDLRKFGSEVHFVLGWSRTTMLLSASGYLQQSEHLIAECRTEPYEPPRSLLDWARRQSLLPVQQYKTIDEFYARVFVALGSMQPKLESVHEPSCFWDIQYDGNRIVSREPKREEDLHSIVQSVLADHLFLSSIDVIREYTTPAGRLDFLLTASIADGTTGKVCVEFKNTHSPSFMHGLKHQLPAYMKAAGVDIGAYCGLDFSGEWMNTKIDELARSAQITVAIGALGTQQWPTPIQYFEYKLGKRPPASRA